MRIFYLKPILFIAIMVLSIYSKGQNHSQMDVRWKSIINNDSILIIKLEIRTETPRALLRDANFAFKYDPALVSFAYNKGYGKKDLDYLWLGGFIPNDSVFTTVTKLKTNTISINIHVEKLFGIPITIDTSYTPVIEIRFRKIVKGAIAKFEWEMKRASGQTFENVFDNDFIPFNIGDGWRRPFEVKL